MLVEPWRSLVVGDEFIAYKVAQPKVELLTEKTHLLLQWKYHCASDLQFGPFGFNSVAWLTLKPTSYLIVWLNLNH